MADTVDSVARDPVPTTTPDAIHATIREAGGRLTVPMRVVVEILLDSDHHPTADDLIAAVNQRVSGISPSTIYRVLSRLDELDIIEHVHSGTGPAFYQLHESSHVHLVCNTCGNIVNVPEAIFEELARSVRAEFQFTIQPRHAALLGQCRNCTAEAGQDEHATDMHRRGHHHTNSIGPLSVGQSNL